MGKEYGAKKASVAVKKTSGIRTKSLKCDKTNGTKKSNPHKKISIRKKTIVVGENHILSDMV